MTSKEATAISHDEIAHLAHLSWEKDGRPHGHDLKYWFESEQQIKATRHLLTSELTPPINQTPVAVESKPDGKPRKSQRLQRAQSI